MVAAGCSRLSAEILTIVVKMQSIPFTYKTMKFMKMVQELEPQIAKIKDTGGFMIQAKMGLNTCPASHPTGVERAKRSCPSSLSCYTATDGHGSAFQRRTP